MAIWIRRAARTSTCSSGKKRSPYERAETRRRMRPTSECSRHSTLRLQTSLRNIISPSWRVAQRTSHETGRGRGRAKSAHLREHPLVVPEGWVVERSSGRQGAFQTMLIYVRRYCRATLICALMASGWAQTRFPSFEEYRVKEVFNGTPAPPQLVHPIDRLFRTRIRQSAAKGPNFAGSYTIAEWGCGSGCISAAVVDARDGTVYCSVRQMSCNNRSPAVTWVHGQTSQAVGFNSGGAG